MPYQPLKSAYLDLEPMWSDKVPRMSVATTVQRKGRARIDPYDLALGTRALTYHDQDSCRDGLLGMISQPLMPCNRNS